MGKDPKVPRRYTLQLVELQRLVRVAETDGGRINSEQLARLVLNVNEISAILSAAGQKEPSQ